MSQNDDLDLSISDDSITNDSDKTKKTDFRVSSMSLAQLVEEFSLGCTYVSDYNHITRGTQTTVNEIADLKNVKNIYKDLNRNLKTVYNAIRVGYNKKVNDSVQELHNNIIQQLLQIEKSYKQNLNTIRQAYHTELINFKIKYKNYQDEALKSAHNKQLTKIINEKNYYADETVKLKKIINDLNNKLFRLKYILVQKYPAKVKQLFSEKNADLNDILDPRDVQIESAMQHLQIDKLKKDNEIRNLKKKLNKVKNDLSKKLEDETEYITVEKHKKIIKELREDFELSRSTLEREKDKEINRLYVESKKLKSIYEAQLLSLRKMQNKTNIGNVLERQNKILELSRMFFPRLTRQSSAISASQIDIKEDNSENNNNNTTTANSNNVNSNIGNQSENLPSKKTSLSKKNSILEKINSNASLSKQNSKNSISTTTTNNILENLSLSKQNSIMEKRSSFINNNINNRSNKTATKIIENIPNRPFSSYFPSEYVRKK